ncbi:MAG TPA: hypothetical protein P5244_06965 [Syntrophales bacterium]|nr:hypothetical protein [Syntrophales bacterium]
MIDRDEARIWSKERIREELSDLRRIIYENRERIQECEERIREREKEIHPGSIVERLENSILGLEKEIADVEMDILFLKSLL